MCSKLWFIAPHIHKTTSDKKSKMMSTTQTIFLNCTYHTICWTGPGFWRIQMRKTFEV